jgi:hypothetical protein
MSFGGSSKGRNVNEQFTTLWLTGGYDCTSNPRNLHVDLRVAGGIYTGKSLCVAGDICGDIITKNITSKNINTGIDIIGNVYVDSLYTLFANESVLKYVSVSNISEKEDGQGIDVTSNINMEVDTIFNGDTICVNKELQTNIILPKTGDVVTIDGDLFVNGNTNIGNIVIDLEDIKANTIESNIVCVNDNLLVNNIYPKSGGLVTVYGNILGQEVDADLVEANILCAQVELQTPSIVPKNGDTIEIGGNIIPSANIAFNLGSSTNRWNDVYGNTMYMSFIDGLSPITAKTDFLPSDDLEFNLGVYAQRWKTLCVGDIDNTGNLNGNIVMGNSIMSGNDVTANIVISDVVITDEINSTGNGVVIEGVLALDSSLVANVMAANIGCFDIIKPKTGNVVTIDGDLFLTGNSNISGNIKVDLDHLVANVITANIVCINDELLINTIKPKTGNVVTIDGDLFLTGNSNISGNINVDLDHLVANVITANVVCINDELLINTIKPKTGNVITANVQLFESQVISATTSFDYKRTLVTTPVYNIKIDDDIISVLYTSTGNVQLILPKITTLPFNRKKYSIVDEGGKSGINSITIFANISDQVMGGMTTEITGNYNSLQLYSNEIDHWFYH